MRAFKCQCSLFKDYYSDFLVGREDEETKAWMKKHKEECSFCREWARSVDENREDIIAHNNVEKGVEQKKQSRTKKIKLFIPLSVITVALVGVWISTKLIF